MTFADLIGKQIVVNVRSEEEAEEFVRGVLENGLAESGWSHYGTCYNAYKSNTCYEIDDDGWMFFGYVDWYIEKGYDVITVDDIDYFSSEEIPLSSDNINDLLM